MKRIFIAFAAMMMLACTPGKSGEVSSTNDGAQDVYVFGYERDSTSISDEYPEGKSIVVYWKDGKSYVISEETGVPEGYDEFSPMDMMIVDGNRVYLGAASRKGSDDSDLFIYEKGKFSKIMSHEGCNGLRLCYIGGKIKMIGCVEARGENNALIETPAIWDMDGNCTKVDMGEYTNCNLNDIAVSGDDWYACGRVYGEDIWHGVGAIWKNGKLSTYPAPDNGITMFGFTAIGVSGSDVYTTMVSGKTKGDDNCGITLWKNGKVETELVKPLNLPMTECIAIDGKDVFVGGYNEKMVDEENRVMIGSPSIWKNGKLMDIDKMDEMGRIASIAVSNGNVYATGDHVFSGALWSNGKMTLLPGADGEGTAVKVLIGR